MLEPMDFEQIVVEEAVQAESFPVESDLLPRIADYYLADPERYGVLYREISRWFEVPGLERRWPDAVWDAIGRGDWGRRTSGTSGGTGRRLRRSAGTRRSSVSGGPMRSGWTR